MGNVNTCLRGGSNSKPLQYSCLENPRTEDPGGPQSIGSQSHMWLKTQAYKFASGMLFTISQASYLLTEWSNGSQFPYPQNANNNRNFLLFNQYLFINHPFCAGGIILQSLRIKWENAKWSIYFPTLCVFLKFIFGRSMQDLSSPTRDRIRAPCSRSTKSYPLDCQESPSPLP